MTEVETKRLKQKAGLSAVNCTTNTLQSLHKHAKTNLSLFNFLIYNLLSKKLFHISTINYGLLTVPLRLNLKML